MSTATGLRKAGLLNEETGDLRDLMTGFNPTRMDAYCSSRRCAGDYPSKKGRLNKNAVYPQENCPDCGFALFWKHARI